MRLNFQSSIRTLRSARGFTLVEMIVVMVVTGILGGMITMLISGLVQGYVDSARRAEISYIADIALNRLTHDLRRALPNSVQVHSASGVYYLDFLSVTGGGRYRAASDALAVGAPCGTASAAVLDFNAVDTCFEALGSQVQFQPGDQVVINNLGIAGWDAYSGNTTATDVRRAYAGVTGTPVSAVVINSGNLLPGGSASHGFYNVHEQVRYICDPVFGHVLTRYWGFTIDVPSAVIPIGGSSAVLATNIDGCSFSIPPTGLVTMLLKITKDGDSVSLYGAAHVRNVP